MLALNSVQVEQLMKIGGVGIVGILVQSTLVPVTVESVCAILRKRLRRPADTFAGGSAPLVAKAYRLGLGLLILLQLLSLASVFAYATIANRVTAPGSS